MSDLIDRQVALDALGEGAMVNYQAAGHNNGLIKAIDVIKGLPSAQPEQRWIPCSERLPEDYEDVLVWFEYFRYGDYNRLYQTHGIGDYSSEYDSWMINHESGWSKLRVLAWMPLPEPYKEGTDNQITACPMCPDCPDNCPLGEDMRGDDHEND